VRPKPSAFTLIELLISISILGVLAALLVPALKQGVLAAQKADSIGNLKSIHQMTMVWASEHDNYLPASYSNGGDDTVIWFIGITDPVRAFDTTGMFRTKVYDKALRKLYPTLVGPTYAMNMMGIPPGGNWSADPNIRVKLTYIKNPSSIVLYSLASPLQWGPAWFGYGNGMNGTGWPSRPYNNTSLIAFCDGHVENVKANPQRGSGLDLPDSAWVPEVP